MSGQSKVAIVTGVSGGMGKTLASNLLEEGMRVIGCDTQAPDLSHEQFEFAEVDVTNEIDVQREVDGVLSRHGRIDYLINFAGITQNKPLVDITSSDWDRMMAVNLKGVFLFIRACLPTMMSQNMGAIVNISSSAARLGGGYIGTAHYAASKAGVLGLTRAAAKEAAAHNVRVNAVAPGLTETGMTQELLGEKRQALVATIPLGFVGEPEDIVRPIMFLLSDNAKYITGVTLDVNGGIVMP